MYLSQQPMIIFRRCS